MDANDRVDRIERAESIRESAEEDPTSVDVESVVDHLATEDGAVRHEAARAFTQVTTARPEVVAPAADRLASLLDAEDAAVRNGAAVTVAQLADRHGDELQSTAPALRALVERDDEYARNNALLALATLGEANPDVVAPATDTLAELLGEGNPNATRERAARAFAAIAGDCPERIADNAGALRAFLASGLPTADTDGELAVSRRDVEAAVEENSRADAAIEHAASAVKDAATASPRRFAARTDDLAALAVHEDEVVATAALDALTAVAETAPAEVHDRLEDLACTVATSDSEAVQLRAAMVVSTLAEARPEATVDELREHVPALRDLLDADSARARTVGATMLSYVAEVSPETVRTAVPSLVAALDDGELAVRASAAHALGFAGTEDAVDALETLATDDPASEVRGAAREALAIAGADSDGST